MNDFIAKYQDQLNGTLSGFDRLVFSLCRSSDSSLGGWLPALRPSLRIAAQDNIVEGPIGDGPAQVPVPVSLPDASRGRLQERSSADLVSLFSAHLPQRPGVAGRQMDQAGISYRRQDNCFTWIENVERAQTMMNEQRTTNWVQLFDPIVEKIHPLLFSEMCVNYPMKYFWSCQDSEWATDLMFRNCDQLRRPNGARLKHRLGPNSLKLYDRAYDEREAVLRAELTITQAKYFQVYRQTNDPDSVSAWRPMRQGTDDMHHRAIVSQNAVNRYYCALAAVDDKQHVGRGIYSVEDRVRWKGQSVRAIHPFDPDDYA